jgi:hypothetical protein
MYKKELRREYEEYLRNEWEKTEIVEVGQYWKPDDYEHYSWWLEEKIIHTGWTKVSDRWPVANKNILVYSKEKLIRVWRWDWIGSKTSDEIRKDLVDITHWAHIEGPKF